MVMRANGYLDSRKLPEANWCALLQFAFTWAVVVDLKVSGYGRRYCYEHYEDASRALEEWDGIGHPSGPWVKCKGAGIDLLNPNL